MQVERSRTVSEMAGTQRLSEIHCLSREVEELKMKADMVRKLRERVEQLEYQLTQKGTEVGKGLLVRWVLVQSHACTCFMDMCVCRCIMLSVLIDMCC